MKNLKKILASALVLIMALGMSTYAFAASGGEAAAESGFAELPAGTYTYVSGAPAAEAGSGAGQVQFLYGKDQITWAFGAAGAVTTGAKTLTGDELEFFKGLYLSDRPVTDWLGGNPKNTEGYAGNVADSVQITITEAGKISKILVANPATRALAILSQDITDATLTVQGSTRGQPNLLQSCITLVGSTNGLYLTVQGDVILDGITIGHGDDGVGLRGDKIGGDVFVVGTVAIDGTIEWHGKKGVITALGDRPGTLLTNGQDIHMTGGSNIGRVGRDLTISTGADKGGDIIIGDAVSCDATRGGLLPNADTSTDSLAIATSGSIIAGSGNVVIGTNTEKAVLIDIIGDIQGANVTIKPIDWGKPGNISMAVGNITATENIDIVVGQINPGVERVNISQSSVGEIMSTGNTSVAIDLPDNPIGNLTAQNGNITFVSGKIGGGIGTVSAPNGTVDLDIESAENVNTKSAAIAVDGKTVTLDGYLIADNHYFTLDSLKGILSGAKLENVTVSVCSIGGGNYVKLRDVGAAADFSIAWDSTANTIIIDTSKGYTL